MFNGVQGGVCGGSATPGKAAQDNETLALEPLTHPNDTITQLHDHTTASHTPYPYQYPPPQLATTSKPWMRGGAWGKGRTPKVMLTELRAGAEPSGKT
jgi:hypothetical protein